MFEHGVLQMASGPDRRQALALSGMLNGSYPGHTATTFSQVRSGSDSIIALIRSGWLSLQTEVLTARAEIAGTATPRLKYSGKGARSGPGGQKEHLE